MRRREFCGALLTIPALIRSARAEGAAQLTLAMQHGLPYLPLMVMQEQRLVEKHAAAMGLGGLKVGYTTLGGTASLIDALLAGQVNFAVTGTVGLATLWDKTVGTPREVKALCAVQSMPYLLITKNPAVKTIDDFTEQDRIALPAVKVSAMAVCLEMAAAHRWGLAEFARLDQLTVSRSHPDAAIALMSKSTDITAHYGAAPFYYLELENSGLHKVLHSYDTLGGPTTNGVMIASNAYMVKNPQISTEIYRAIDEANAFINSNGLDAAKIYASYTDETRTTPEKIARMIADPENVWTTTPQNTMAYFDFMHQVGTIKRKPDSWKDYFVPEAHVLSGG